MLFSFIHYRAQFLNAIPMMGQGITQGSLNPFSVLYVTNSEREIYTQRLH